MAAIKSLFSTKSHVFYIISLPFRDIIVFLWQFMTTFLSCEYNNIIEEVDAVDIFIDRSLF